MSKKRIIVGVICLIPFVPVVMVGFIWEFGKHYFEAGQTMAGDMVYWIDKKLGE
jgi:hypothetical protein